MEGLRELGDDVWFTSATATSPGPAPRAAAGRGARLTEAIDEVRARARRGRPRPADVRRARAHARAHGGAVAASRSASSAARGGAGRGRRARGLAAARPAARGARGDHARPGDRGRPVEPGDLDRSDPRRARPPRRAGRRRRRSSRCPARARRGAEGSDRRLPRVGRPPAHGRTGSPRTTTASSTGSSPTSAPTRCLRWSPTSRWSTPRRAAGSRATRWPSPPPWPVSGRTRIAACARLAVLPVKRFAPPSSASPTRSPRASGGRWRRRCSPTCSPRWPPFAEIDDVIVVTGEPLAARAAPRRGRRRRRPRRGGPDGGAARGHRGGDGARRRACAARARRLPGRWTPRSSTAARARAADAPSVVIVPDRHGTRDQRAAAHPARRDGAVVRRGERSRATWRRAHAAGATVTGRATSRRSASTSTRRTTSTRCALALEARPETAARTRAVLSRLVAAGTRSTAVALPGPAGGAPGRRPRRAAGAAAGQLRRRSRDGDVLAVAHKVVSKAEGRVVRLADVSARRARRARWPPSTARTRGTCRSCSTSPPRSCAPTAGG